MSEFRRRNLAATRQALDHHNSDCPEPARAILLSPTDHGLLGWDLLWGVPVLADERVPIKKIRIACNGSAWGIEAELADHLSVNAG
jgi:hypothetical protein